MDMGNEDNDIVLACDLIPFHSLLSLDLLPLA